MDIDENESEDDWDMEMCDTQTSNSMPPIIQPPPKILTQSQQPIHPSTKIYKWKNVDMNEKKKLMKKRIHAKTCIITIIKLNTSITNII